MKHGIPITLWQIIVLDRKDHFYHQDSKLKNIEAGHYLQVFPISKVWTKHNISDAHCCHFNVKYLDVYRGFFLKIIEKYLVLQCCITADSKRHDLANLIAMQATFFGQIQYLSSKSK